MKAEDLFRDKRLVMFFFYSYKKEDSGIATFLRTIGHKLSVEFQPHRNLFFNDVDREDHAKLFQITYEQCLYDKGIMKLSWYRYANFHNLKNIFKYSKRREEQTIRESISKYAVENNMQLSVTSERLEYIYYKIIQMIEFYDQLTQLDFSKVDNVIVLADAIATQNILVLYANSLGKTTVTESHGVFPPVANDINDINIIDSPAKYFLAMGDSTKKLLDQYSKKSNCVICGDPYVEPNTGTPNLHLIAVASDVPAHKNANQRMICIAEEYAVKHDCRVQIRLHPTDSEKNYKINSSVTEFNRNTDNAGVFVSYTSSMLITYMAQNRHALRYKGDLPYFNIDDQISFTDEASFEKAMKASEDFDYLAESRKFMEYIGDESRAKYRTFFDCINKYNCEVGK